MIQGKEIQEKINFNKMLFGGFAQSEDDIPRP